jgi:hypothetical protein
LELPILTNQNEYPTEAIIFSHIGKSKALWKLIFEFLHTKHTDLKEEWKYYNDGKSWLLKVMKKSKTIFWLSVQEGSFRITFYFTDRAEKAIIDSSISEELKEQYRSGKHYNKIRGITITFKFKKDVEDAKSLVAIKLSIK